MIQATLVTIIARVTCFVFDIYKYFFQTIHMSNEHEPPIIKAIRIAGSQSELARRVKVTPQSVQQWVTANKVPAERVLDVEEATGVSRYELRSDLYPLDDSAETFRNSKSIA